MIIFPRLKSKEYKMTLMNLYSNDDVNLVEEEFGYFATIPLINGFRFIGWTIDITQPEEDSEYLGYLSTDGNYYIPVFIHSHYPKVLSEREYEEEQEAIDKGKNVCIFVHGARDISYIKRYTTKELKYIDFSFFDDNDVHEGFVYDNL